MTKTWKAIECQGIDEVLKVLNGRVTRGKPVVSAKIGIGPKNTVADQPLSSTKFDVLYLNNTRVTDQYNWEYQKADSHETAIDLLNTLGQQTTILNLLIVGLFKKTGYIFLIFYQQGERTGLDLAGPWHWIKKDQLNSVNASLNGEDQVNGPMQHPRITTILAGNSFEFHIFYRPGDNGQLRNGWFCRIFTSREEVVSRLNWGNNLESPVSDQILVSTVHTPQQFQGYVFHPKGFLIITRPCFENSLSTYIRWKEARGFEVYLLTAEIISTSHDGLSLREKIKNCIVKYSNSRWVSYALLIGDADENIPISSNDQLSSPWHLPAGYYSFGGQPLFTTLYYGDSSLKTNYNQNEYFQGEYVVAVGVIPARSEHHLTSVLAKTMRAKPANQLTMLYSQELWNEYMNNASQQILNLASTIPSCKKFVFQGEVDTTETCALSGALFDSPGVVFVNGHGNVDHFLLGNTKVKGEDGRNFRHINPLFIAQCCYVQSYYSGKGLAEAFLCAARGPAVVLVPRFPANNIPGTTLEPLSSSEKMAWQDILSGKSIGKAVTTYAKGATSDSIHIFGDPSAVIFPGTPSS